MFVVLCPLPGKARVVQGVQSDGGGGGGMLYCVHFLGQRVWRNVYGVTGGWREGVGSVVLVVLCPLPGPADVAQGGRGSSLAR